MTRTRLISMAVALACAACDDTTDRVEDAGNAPAEDAGEARAEKQTAKTSSAENTAKTSSEDKDTANKTSTSKNAEISDWRTLVEGEWELAGGEEGYRCARLTATEDLYIKEFQPIAPVGTHHTLLSVNEEATEPDGITECGPNDNGHVTLLGSGVGEDYSSGPLPDGVAYRIPKGAQLNLNLHLFNVRDEKLKGTSGVKIRTTTADKVDQFAQVTLAGPVMLSIPSGKSISKGQCTLASDATLFAVSPHMHQLGKHLKAVAKPATGEPVTLYDGPYDFNEQRQYPANMQKLKAGDTIEVECTYENPTDSEVKFGNSSLSEMCFIGLYRYPLTEDELVCAR